MSKTLQAHRTKLYSASMHHPQSLYHAAITSTAKMSTRCPKVVEAEEQVTRMSLESSTASHHLITHIKPTGWYYQPMTGSGIKMLPKAVAEASSNYRIFRTISRSFFLATAAVQLILRFSSLFIGCRCDNASLSSWRHWLTSA